MGHSAILIPPRSGYPRRQGLCIHVDLSALWIPKTLGDPHQSLHALLHFAHFCFQRHVCHHSYGPCAKYPIFSPRFILPLRSPPKQTRVHPKPFLTEHTTEDQNCEFPLHNKCDMCCAECSSLPNMKRPSQGRSSTGQLLSMSDKRGRSNAGQLLSMRNKRGSQWYGGRV